MKSSGYLKLKLLKRILINRMKRETQLFYLPQDYGFEDILNLLLEAGGGSQFK